MEKNQCKNHNSEVKEYTPLESLDEATIKDLKELEKKLQRNQFIKGPIISIDDVHSYENFLLLNIDLPKDEYPKIYKWKVEIERFKHNWKISKKVNGRTFLEYIQNITRKIDQQNKVYDDKLKEITNFSNNILKHENPEKEVTTIHFFEKKDSHYQIKVLVKMLPNQEQITANDLSSKLAIISHNHFRNKSQIEPINNPKEGISAIISTTIDKKEYDIENLAQDIKRNIQGIYSVSILSIEEKKI